MPYILAYDLGTGGVKASIFDEECRKVASTFCEYNTVYPLPLFQEQKPDDWWCAVIQSTKLLSQKVDLSDIVAIASSGHSLGVVAIDKKGQLLSEYTPIWSDARATSEASEFFKCINQDEWYMRTGAGFPAQLYSIFKICWYKRNLNTLYDAARCFIGSKDYINFKLTNVIRTDFSYASGCGVYDLNRHTYVNEWLEEVDIPIEKFASIQPSNSLVGYVTNCAASQLGIKSGIPVICGGVDNACMALGAACMKDGDVYTSLGTSAWVAVSSEKPVLEKNTKPYVFEHCVEGQYVSATCIFSAGRSFRWIRDTMCLDLMETAEAENVDVYDLMTSLAKESPIGSNKLMFNPSLSGGSSLDPSPNLRGSFVGIDLLHTRSDMIRSTMEGITLNLRVALDALGKQTTISDEMLIVGGCAKSELWKSIFADVFNKRIVTSDVGQDAGALGAALLAGTGIGLYKDYNYVRKAHLNKAIVEPNLQNSQKYARIMPVFQQISHLHSELGDMMKDIEI